MLALLCGRFCHVLGRTFEKAALKACRQNGRLSGFRKACYRAGNNHNLVLQGSIK